MPTQTVSAETMQVGRKGRGKHWTAAQVEARQRANDEFQRKKPVDLRPPEWLGEEELVMWYWAIDQAKDVKLFDNLDVQTLAVYCNAVVEYRDLARMKRKSAERIQQQQAWARIIAQYADKLGFNPSARARLIKKKVEEKLDEFGKKFD
jgi:phage terminase small subunit